MHLAGSSARSFRCTCTRKFTQESAYTKHQRSCAKGKKRLFSALSKAKDFLGSMKRPRLDANGGRREAHVSMESSSMQLLRPQPQSMPPERVNEGLSAESSNIYSALSEGGPTLEAPCSSLQGNTPISISTLNVGAAPAVIDDNSSLAQRRTRRTDVQMPLHYQQHEDVLPQPPPSIPSQAASLRESVPPSNPTNVPNTTYTSLQYTPFRTARNVFGLVRQFFSSTPPTHDPEEAATLQDLSSIPTVSPADLDGVAEPHDPFYPYPNQSSFKLRHWYWNGSVQKSHQSFKDLVDIIGCPDFDPGNVQGTHWDKINSQLGASIDDEGGDEWEDEDAGWHKTPVVIEVPLSRTTAHPDARPYAAANLYHRPLVSVIREKLTNVHDDEHFHYEPYELRWQPPHLPHEVNIQGKLYTLPAFMHAHRELQASLGEAGCNLPRVIAALMFWSNATQLTTFGNAKLWPIYMYFGNEPKYHRCRPSCHLGNHVAYFQKLLDSFKDFAGTHTEGKGIGHECTTHCHRELFQGQWRVLLDDEFLEAYCHEFPTQTIIHS
ncbi:hypothetical protein BDR06DRAFT_1009120 [Suillus hirtellus]|nr:hypothetical protein BDR06DRAFT_1009120 [Suillus hirtellus]